MFKKKPTTSGADARQQAYAALDVAIDGAVKAIGRTALADRLENEVMQLRLQVSQSKPIW
jgi:hypothetical protein